MVFGMTNWMTRLPQDTKNKWQTAHTGQPNVMTREAVLRYYSNPKNSSALLNDIVGKRTMIYSMFDGKRTLIRKHNGKPIVIRRISGDGPDSIEYWARRHAVDFHRTLSGNEPEAIIDIDPNSVDMDRVKRVTADISKKVGDIVRNQTIQFSGNRGFYIRGESKSMPAAKNEILKLVKEYVSKNKDVVLTRPASGEIRIDFAPMKRLGTHRAVNSLDMRTGLRSMTVGDLDGFVPSRDALPDAGGK